MKRLLLVVAFASAAMGAPVTLTMTEVAAQGINGLAVASGGITFTFSDTGGGLFYNSASGGVLTYVQDPSIAGTPEPFSVAFSVPVNFIQVAMYAAPNTSGAAIATLRFYNGATLINTMTLNSSVAHPSEGQLTYSPTTPVTSITVTPAGSLSLIAFDNLTVTAAPASVPAVPATSPLTLALMTLGIVGFGGYALRRRFGLSTSY